MKAKIELALFAITLVTLPAYAEKKIYGRIDYGYINDQVSYGNYESEQMSFLQNYILGYRSYIYSPRLLQYTLEAGMSLNSTETDTTVSSYSSDSSVTNYRGNLSFLSGTWFPFSIYADKTSNPYENTLSTSSFSSNQTTEQYGINGMLQMSLFNFNYSFGTSKTDRTDPFSTDQRNNQDIKLNLTKKKDNSSLSIGYDDYVRESTRISTDGSATQNSWTDNTRQIHADYRWTPDKTVSIGTSGSYQTSSLIDMKSATGTVNLAWNPTEKYSAGAVMSASKMNVPGMEYSIFNVGLNSAYYITPEMSATQNLVYYSSDSNFYSSKTAMLSLGGNYSKQLENNVRIGINGSVTGRMEQTETDSNTSIVGDRKSYGTLIAANTSKLIEAYKTRMNLGVSYSTMSSNLDDKTNHMGVNGGLSSEIADNISYSLNGYLNYDDSTVVAGTGERTTTNMETMGADMALRYWSAVGSKGQFSSSIGVAYAKSITNEREYSRLYPNANMSFNYALTSALNYTSSAYVSRDMMYDLTNYSVNMGLNYLIRSITISTGAKLGVQTGNEIAQMSQRNIFIRASRPF